MKKRHLIFILLLAAAITGFAQKADDVIAVKLFCSADKLEKGTSNPISIEIKIEEPYHINSQQPTEDYLIPLSIGFEEQENIVFGKMEFPEPEIKLLGFSDIPLSIYEGTIIVRTSITIPASYNGENIMVEGKIGYQACDDNSCLAPTELSFNRSFPVTASSGAKTSGDVSGTKKKNENVRPGDVSQVSEEGEFAQTVGKKGLFLTFLLVFLGGLALNLTPCVYPIIPITVGYFGGQAKGRKGGVITHAIFYVLGMAVTYSALGVIAALTGSLFGSALQNPFVLVGIALVLVALALSMFDLYEFRLPSFLTNLAGGSKKGYLGTIFMGLTVGLVAAPCIGPFVLGLLTYVGEKGDVLLGFLLFFVLAVGLGIPFIFLAVFSGSITKLPKSGSWMVWVRTIFGFILVAMAIYFLKPLFPNSLLYHLALAINLFLGGIYMAWIEPTQLESKVFPLIRNIVGLVFFTAALFFAVSGIQSYVDERLHEVSQGSGLLVSTEMIQWAAYTDSRIKEAQEQSKPVLIDFYTDWCIPCKELDKHTFTDEKVADMAEKFVMLKVDLTSTDHPVYEKLRKKFQIKGVPTLVLLTSDGKEDKKARIVGFIKPLGLLAKMKKVLI